MIISLPRATSAVQKANLPAPLARSWYGAAVSEFLPAEPDAIIGTLTRHSHFSVDQTQTRAWVDEIAVMKSALQDLRGTGDTTITPLPAAGAIFFEFVIPRMGRRVDVILVIGPLIIAIEFKAGESSFHRSAIEQVWDYALDLKNFHETSHHAAILPILIATGARTAPAPDFRLDADNVYRPIRATTDTLALLISAALAHAARHTSAPPINTAAWLAGSYRPTPTIVEAARALYANHNVDAIARHDAGATNLTLTSRRIEELIDEARAAHRKIIAFVTGVPGAGKTLVGLNIATHRRDETTPTHAVFLSGNGPLVDVLREALTRDEYQRKTEECKAALAAKSSGTNPAQVTAPTARPTKGRIRESVKAFIQNVHHFRDEGLRDPHRPPADHVVIFDEAQRAWNLQQTRNFMQRKKNQPGFNMSEPQFLISYMDRHTDWAFIVCLVGGGQEINQGEAGISAWITAVRDHFPHWQMLISDKLTDSEYAAAAMLVNPAAASLTPNVLPHTHLDQPQAHIEQSPSRLLDRGGLTPLSDPRRQPTTSDSAAPTSAAKPDPAPAATASAGSATAATISSAPTPPATPAILFDPSLHLSVSMRSFRAENVSNFVKQLLDLNLDAARDQFQQLQHKYPLRITRDLPTAKQWLRQQARGTERTGLVASSKAMRLKPHAIFIGTNNDVLNPVHYFLNDSQDVRSSLYLEDAATEFQVQGLELDWVCLSWDADLRLTRPNKTSDQRAWSFHDFKGTKWQNIHTEDRRRYTLNAYRVLLTRARQGMVIFVPPGDVHDHTRPPEYYDETFAFLRDVGVESIN